MRAMKCAICGHMLKMIYQWAHNFSMSSENGLVKEGITLYECSACGHLQKFPKQSTLHNIYSNYQTDVLLPNTEQSHFDTQNNQISRSQIILEHCAPYLNFTHTPKILDYGAGGGGMLYSFIKNFPHAETYAYDVSRHNEHLFWEIPNFSRFWDNVEAIEGRFDCITLIHCLEHIGDIRKTASKLYTLLKDSGVVIIQVPDVAQNMWDIFTYDHCHHFSFYTLYKLFVDAGFYVSLPHHQIARQITLLASKQPLKQGIENLDMFYFDCKHLNDVLALLESLRTNGSSGGVFGTTISTFVALVLGEWAQCFYDEDKRKIGKTHLGLPIVSPSEGDGCEIVMPLGESLYAKLSAKYPKHHFIRAF